MRLFSILMSAALSVAVLTGCGESGSSADGANRIGETIYNRSCFSCHAAGVAEAPIPGDTEAWAPRIAKGLDVLVASTVDGLGMMPAKGTCMDCSDEELAAAVDYILAEAQ